MKKYDLELVSYLRLLKGQEKENAAGGKLIDRYYCFSYKEKNTKEKTFYCGTYVGKSFVELLGIEPPPLSDPLKHPSKESGGKPRGR